MAENFEVCAKCGKKSTRPIKIKGISYCQVCGPKVMEEIVKGSEPTLAQSYNVLITTTNNFEGYRITEYLGVESVEIVIGTGLISEFTSSISDFFGKRSTDFERKLKEAKKTAFEYLKESAKKKGGNAVVGLDIDYVQFTENRIGIVVNGTIVKIVEI